MDNITAKDIVDLRIKKQSKMKNYFGMKMVHQQLEQVKS